MAFDVADNVTNIGAAGEERVNGLDEFIFVFEDMLPDRRANAAAVGPELGASDMPAGATAFVVRAIQMDQVARL